MEYLRVQLYKLVAILLTSPGEWAVYLFCLLLILTLQGVG